MPRWRLPDWPGPLLQKFKAEAVAEIGQDLLHCPLGSVFRVFHCDSQSFEVVADGVAGRPVLRRLGLGALFQNHIH